MSSSANPCGPGGWPIGAKFEFGAAVQRADVSLRPPSYRFPGTVCGWYVSERGTLGYAVSRDGDPGCVQIFPEHWLEARS